MTPAQKEMLADIKAGLLRTVPTSGQWSRTWRGLVAHRWAEERDWRPCITPDGHEALGRCRSVLPQPYEVACPVHGRPCTWNCDPDEWSLIR